MGGITGFLVNDLAEPETVMPGMQNSMQEKGAYHRYSPDAGFSQREGGQRGMSPNRNRMIEEVAGELDLSSEQRAKIETAVRDYMSQHMENRQKARENIGEHFSELVDLVKNELTDEQEEKLDKLIEERAFMIHP